MPGFTTGSDLNPEFRRRLQHPTNELQTTEMNPRIANYSLMKPVYPLEGINRGAENQISLETKLMCLQGTALPTKIQIPVTGLS